MSLEATGVEAAPFRPGQNTVVATRGGWPVDCPLGLAGRDAPHDPDVANGELLLPPVLDTWSPASRRKVADQIATELEAPPDDEDGAFARLAFGETDLGPGGCAWSTSCVSASI